jgi:hypothetical protein
VPQEQIIRMVAVLAISIVAAPVVVFAQRRLFSLFLAEGAELLGDVTIAKQVTLPVGALMAKLNALVLLVAWLGLFTCRCFDVSWTVRLPIALAGVAVAILITTVIVHNTVRRLNGGTTMIVGLIVFAGGNLPLIVVAATLFAIFG